MKKFKLKSLTIMTISLLLIFVISSCKKEKYPKYSLTTIEFIPDSLKDEHRKFITETVRAASQHMTGGDYEDVDETISQAERTSFNTFSVTTIGLKKQINDNLWDDLKLLPIQFTSYEKQLFDSMINNNQYNN